ncbi:MAG: hypothetical protein A2418_01855 [Candidatus Brennerbacteria bacterium RIFOXYC1_FULL_41_11]|uniref:Uncharacterized protein n=1 Tax=Candidatus Brennerbacteria bacterium RIFOXYD1_FULL_41_16 TaxID=1797529 RepID=A0A1G1XL27_9BACT|nr:MAG: hypothetical protein UU61_C0001G0020 [Parcubacteria group bacterium GW2011_GWB1_41_4]OGY39897.1 MAG: hypothetical protein A2418_01855 [Candidatus Brennerbacteria bacterium RIFOXYC1_FULL_41_11]OGY40708.1 MAG: hypothetical protein A2570_01070 [Candidatus Brennerbacteria bacterium RIFOXYD1_FULL_41_16]
MFYKFFDYLKDLKKGSKKTRRAFYIWTILAVVPLVAFLFVFSMKSGVRNALSSPESGLTLGEQATSVFKDFFGDVWQGAGLIFKNTSEFFRSEKFLNMLRSVFGGPKIEVLEPGPEINLPIAEW